MTSVIAAGICLAAAVALVWLNHDGMAVACVVLAYLVLA